MTQGYVNIDAFSVILYIHLYFTDIFLFFLNLRRILYLRYFKHITVTQEINITY